MADRTKVVYLDPGDTCEKLASALMRSAEGVVLKSMSSSNIDDCRRRHREQGKRITEKEAKSQKRVRVYITVYPDPLEDDPPFGRMGPNYPY